MSGVGGVRVFSPGWSAGPVLEDMTRLLHHRGPDSRGVWLGDDVGLVHTRLAAVDVGDVAQPVHSADGRWVVAFDGAVHNRESLRAQLGQPLRTRGDAELVAAGLALHGISFVDRLEGQCAFAAHDVLTDTTHLVRDRLGVLPLYYRPVPGGVAFASEIKALLTVGPAPRVDERSLDAYLGARSVPAPHTLFDGVKKVRPGHRLVVQPGGHVEEVAYWTVPECDPDGTWSQDDAVEAVRDGVRESVRSTMLADGPVGAHLSGGLDSSLVVAQLRELRGDDAVHTFAAGFPGHPLDPLPSARRVSDLLGTRHHEVHLRAGDFEVLWSELTWHRDGPVSEPWDVAVLALAREARHHVPAVLSGDGADELFGGYARHRHVRPAARTTVVPDRLRAAMSGALGGRHGTWSEPFTARERRRLLGAEAPPDRRVPPGHGADAVDRILRHEVAGGLPDDLLERADRLSMAASVQTRPPLLDHHLVELAFRLPTSVKVRGATTKWVLREAARPVLPDELVVRRQGGPHPPLDAWFRDGLRDAAHDRLTGPGSWVADALDGQAVRALIDRHERGADEEVRLWTLMCLEMWHERFFSDRPTVPAPRDAAGTAAEVGGLDRLH